MWSPRQLLQQLLLLVAMLLLLQLKQLQVICCLAAYALAECINVANLTCQRCLAFQLHSALTSCIWLAGGSDGYYRHGYGHAAAAAFAAAESGKLSDLPMLCLPSRNMSAAWQVVRSYSANSVSILTFYGIFMTDNTYVSSQIDSLFN